MIKCAVLHTKYLGFGLGLLVSVSCRTCGSFLLHKGISLLIEGGEIGVNKKLVCSSRTFYRLLRLSSS